MFRFVLSKIFILDKPLEISRSKSLNSFTKGGNTRIKIEKTIKDITVNTKNKDKGLGILNPLCISLHKLHTIFEITKEQIIKRRNPLKVHIIKDAIKMTANLKYKELLNLNDFLLLLRIS